MSTNKYVSITPNVVTVSEFNTFTQTFSIAYDSVSAVANGDPATYDFVFYDIYKDPLLSDTQSEITFAKVSDLSFSITGTFSDVFDRSIKYIDKDTSKPATVSRFSDLPSEIGTIYSYIPPTATSTSFSFTIRLRPTSSPLVIPVESTLDTYIINFIVNPNRDKDNELLLDLIKSGSFYQTSLEKGYTE